MTKRSPSSQLSDLKNGPVSLLHALQNVENLWLAFTDILDHDSNSRELLLHINIKDGRWTGNYEDLDTTFRAHGIVHDIDNTPTVELLQAKRNTIGFPNDDDGWGTYDYMGYAIDAWRLAYFVKNNSRNLWFNTRETLDTTIEIASMLLAIIAIHHRNNKFRYPFVATTLIAVIIQAVKNATRVEATTKNSSSHMENQMSLLFGGFNEAFTWSCEFCPDGNPDRCIHDFQDRSTELKKIIQVLLFTKNIDPLPRYSNFQGKLSTAVSYKSHLDPNSEDYVREILVENLFPANRRGSSFPPFHNLPIDLINAAEKAASSGKMITCETKWVLQYSFQ